MCLLHEKQNLVDARCDLHKEQKRIDCFDYLIYKMENRKRNDRKIIETINY